MYILFPKMSNSHNSRMLLSDLVNTCKQKQNSDFCSLINTCILFLNKRYMLYQSIILNAYVCTFNKGIIVQKDVNSQSSVERSINLDYLLFNSRYLRGNNGFFLRFLLIISQLRHISKNWYYDRIAEWREEEKNQCNPFFVPSRPRNDQL